MKTLDFLNLQEIKVQSICIGGDIDTKELKKGAISTAPLVLEAGKGAYAIVFRYGAVVLFNTNGEDAEKLLQQVKTHTQYLTQETTEETTLRVVKDYGKITENGEIFVQNTGIPTLQVIAEVLARSVVLERFERQVTAAFEAVQPIVKSLGEGKLKYGNHKKLQQHLGSVLLDQQQMIGRMAIADKPDALWEHAELERVYAKLTDEYEIIERYEALDAKLEMLGAAIRTSIDLMQAKHSHRLEWYVILLILVEIVLFAYEIFVKHV